MATREQALGANRFQDTTTGKIWRRNGQNKLWKTRPDEFRIPVKYGLYAYAYVDHTNVDLVEVID